MAFYVYILECADGSYYTGHTDDLEKRLRTHNKGEASGYTSTRLPVNLVFCQDFPTREEAFEAERRIKGWRREKKNLAARLLLTVHERNVPMTAHRLSS